MERRARKSKRGSKGRDPRPKKAATDNQIDALTLSIGQFPDQAPQNAVPTNSQQDQNGQPASKSTPQAAFDTTISEFELEAFLEQQEELRDALRRKTKQTRLAFGARWAPGRPFSWAYVVSAEYLASQVELDSIVGLEPTPPLYYSTIILY